MQLYRLRCECGADTSVGKGQAGGEVTCDGCGRSLRVPMLREFGQLPLAESDSNRAAAPRRWLDHDYVPCYDRDRGDDRRQRDSHQYDAGWKHCR